MNKSRSSMLQQTITSRTQVVENLSYTKIFLKKSEIQDKHKNSISYTQKVYAAVVLDINE